MTLEVVHCIDCIYFNRNTRGRTDLGYCQIDPPIIIPETQNKTGHFPIVGLNTWCGQGQRREENGHREAERNT